MSRERLRTVLLAASILVCPYSATAYEEPLDAAAKYRALVQMLVSPNRAPPQEVEAVTFPKGYDVEAQRRIDAARQRLHAEFEQALPYLVEALGDNRYSMTINWADGDGYYHYSVAEICRDVLASNLEVYREHIWFTGPQHWHSYNFPISKQWQAARPGKKLAELQVEAIDWATKQRNAERDVRPERQGEAAKLDKLRQSIAASGHAAAPRRLLPMVTTDRR